MASADKVEKVRQIAGWFEDSESVLVLRYRGLRVSEANELRAMIGRNDARLRVVKNTLARIALEGTPHQEIARLIDGPVALVFAGREPAAVAKLLKEYSRGRKEFFLLGGWFSDTLITGGQAEELATLPSREVLLARMLGQAAAPLSGLVSVCAGPLRKLLGLFQALAEGREDEPAAGRQPLEDEAVVAPAAGDTAPDDSDDGDAVPDSGPEGEPLAGGEPAAQVDGEAPAADLEEEAPGEAPADAEEDGAAGGEPAGPGD